MEITKKSLAGTVELRVGGRLDAHWADHLTRAIDEILHSGAHHLRVDMSGVSYMSSAGVRVLLRFRKQAQQLSGSFVVVQPSVAVRTVLEMAGLVEHVRLNDCPEFLLERLNLVIITERIGIEPLQHGKIFPRLQHKRMDAHADFR